MGKMSGRILLGFVAAFFFGLVLGQNHTPEEVVGATVRGAFQVVGALVRGATGLAQTRTATQPSKPEAPPPTPDLKPSEPAPGTEPSKPDFDLGDPDAKSAPDKVAASEPKSS